MKKFGTEFKVGAFFLACLFGLLFLTYSTGKLNIKREGYNIYVVFDEVVGLEKSSPVMLNGLEVGQVEEVDIMYDEQATKIRLKIWLPKRVKLRGKPVVSIKTLGLMGEKYIQISSSKGKKAVTPGATLEGKPYLDMDELLDEAHSIGKSLASDVGSLIDNVNNLTDEVKKLAKNLNYTVEGNQDNISQTIENLEAASKNMEEFADDIKRHPWKLLYRTKERKPKAVENKP